MFTWMGKIQVQFGMSRVWSRSFLAAVMATTASLHAAEPTAQLAAISATEELEQIPASLKPLFGKMSYIQRCRFVNGLKSDLSHREVDALLAFISTEPKELGMTRGHFNSVGDKVINKLEAQDTVSLALIDCLITMFEEMSGDFTWRDYCIQHLGSLYGRDVAADKRVEIMQVFKEAMTPEMRMGGTVILALQRNLGKADIAKERVAKMASEVALDDKQDDSSRLTSMQVAAQLGNRAMLPLARELIVSRKPVQLRMSAMATVGMLGDASDLSILGKYTSSPDMRLRGASKAAIKKINMRQLANH
jgi:transcriptional regulator NrdR family protein